MTDSDLAVVLCRGCLIGLTVDTFVVRPAVHAKGGNFLSHCAKKEESLTVI